MARFPATTSALAPTTNLTTTTLPPPHLHTTTPPSTQIAQLYFLFLLKDAAQDLGANERRTFFRVTLPLIAPGVVSAILVSFTVSFDEFVVSFFVSGKGVVTLPLFLYSELRFSVTPEINAISTFVLAISVLVIGLMQWLQGRVGRRR